MAFYFAIKNTLVCKDLDTATGIAYAGKRLRVVTLNGAMIEATGTMSGGGNPRRGGMSFKLQNKPSREEMCKL